MQGFEGRRNASQELDPFPISTEKKRYTGGSDPPTHGWNCFCSSLRLLWFNFDLSWFIFIEAMVYAAGPYWFCFGRSIASAFSFVGLQINKKFQSIRVFTICCRQTQTIMDDLPPGIRKTLAHAMNQSIFAKVKRLNKEKKWETYRCTEEGRWKGWRKGGCERLNRAGRWDNAKKPHMTLWRWSLIWVFM